ncbi:nuclear transport factor 2 family protein [Sinomicrobium weinanense]|uniref:Nuclear transport factor 2 family protein n=1 Tax=Sinomicrobium weinanense TaxID=2842200 RepID=A0A926JVY8_9FLAO|nr:nuclear transport factor 2 family protein [Sinomicrobium weinanense]MBC9798183.1 nuclear transport factor 2 family protein [Sinomicrobium weinanense]MBU3125491.1 nuclear transport factor 2 family protein [Sinomicrobium weinanense]
MTIKNTMAIVFWAMALLSLVSCGEGNQKKDRTTPKAETAAPVPTVADVEAAVSEFNRALENPGREVLERLCSEKLTYGHSSGLVQDREAFIVDVLNGPFDFLEVTAPEQTITLSGNTAVVRHIFQASATRDGEPLEIRIGNMQIYKLSDEGQWLLLARQAYKL